VFFSSIEPDDDPLGSKHVAIKITTNKVKGSYLFNYTKTQRGV